MPKPVLYGILVGLALMLGLFLGARWLVEREHARIPPDKMWTPIAVVAVTASEQEFGAVIGEMSAFAAEKNVAINNLPKKGQKVASVRLSLTPNTYFAVDNYGLASDRFTISAYSHDDPRVWIAEWEALTDRLRARLGNDHVTVRLKPLPN